MCIQPDISKKEVEEIFVESPLTLNRKEQIPRLKTAALNFSSPE
jgi:hypothetical protein